MMFETKDALDELWLTEKAFWENEPGSNSPTMADDGFMLLPGNGYTDGSELADILDERLHFDKVSIRDKRELRPALDVRILVYRIVARRRGLPDYVADCSSTYRREGDKIVMQQHHQCPVG